MPNKSERRRHRAFRRTAKETRMYTKEGKTSRVHCALCEKHLHGVPHGKTGAERKRTAKTHKGPSVVFGGILCAACRTRVVIEAVRVKTGMKKTEDLDLRLKPYVKQLDKKVSA